MEFERAYEILTQLGCGTTAKHKRCLRLADIFNQYHKKVGGDIESIIDAMHADLRCDLDNLSEFTIKAENGEIAFDEMEPKQIMELKIKMNNTIDKCYALRERLSYILSDKNYERIGVFPDQVSMIEQICEQHNTIAKKAKKIVTIYLESKVEKIKMDSNNFLNDKQNHEI